VSRLIVALLILLAASQSQAAVKFYAEARLGAGGVRHSDLDFYPQIGGITAGVFVLENIGIGVEAFAGTTIAPGDEGVFEIEMTETVGAAVRFQSPPQLGGLQAYILLGYVNFELEQNENSTSDREPVRSSFNGVRVGIGIHQRLQVVNGLSFGVEYHNDYADTGITVDGLSLGLRYEMR